MKNQWLLGVALICTIVFTVIFLGQTLNSEAHSKEMPVRYKYYTSITVHYGDTLESIAKEYISDEYKNVDSYIHEVCLINHIEDGDDIIAGKNIVVPYFSSEFK